MVYETYCCTEAMTLVAVFKFGHLTLVGFVRYHIQPCYIPQKEAELCMTGIT